MTNSPSGLSKRKPGRPPKLRSDSGLGVQGQMPNAQPYNADVSHVQPQLQYQGNSAGGSKPLSASLGSGNDSVAVPSPPPTENSAAAAKRGRGRPPKVKRGRGRPRRVGNGPVTAPLSGNVLRPRGRPKRAGRPNAAVNGGAGENGLGSRRSGRPSAVDIAKVIRKPVGRPSKVGHGTAVLVTDPRQLVVYQELKTKYELLQSKVKHVVSVIKPRIEGSRNPALKAIQELESLAGSDTIAPSPPKLRRLQDILN